MGLIKTSGYDVRGILIKPAYAKITRLYNENNDNVVAYFGISNTRENLESSTPIEEIQFNCTIDKKEDKVFNEVYTKAKQELFTEWEDDIVE